MCAIQVDLPDLNAGAKAKLVGRYIYSASSVRYALPQAGAASNHDVSNVQFKIGFRHS